MNKFKKGDIVKSTDPSCTNYDRPAKVIGNKADDGGIVDVADMENGEEDFHSTDHLVLVKKAASPKRGRPRKAVTQVKKAFDRLLTGDETVAIVIIMDKGKVTRVTVQAR